ncbi:hypothetical protein CAPTEDRAFT_194629 [Capitella teleta]|uniref:Uncharacterized protein n=1 Tax=Capitella teleta TaxID=283909 RepID=R7UUV2_CAPTE|nr:hypothetical protein CAPTEDRAFT_194629 [Capitella teleta]|eukprot:ELU09960.1 hypothetical protein CAPTEDRAFT_194629 [Capitella teleta]
MRGKLPSACTPQDPDAIKMKETDSIAKKKMKRYADERRGTRPQYFDMKDRVLVKNQNRRKLDSVYNQRPYEVVAVNGSMITTEAKNGKRITRNASFFKKIECQDAEDEDEDQDDDDLPDLLEPIQDSDPNPASPARRSQRPRRLPEHLKDYVMNT